MLPSDAKSKGTGTQIDRDLSRLPVPNCIPNSSKLPVPFVTVDGNGEPWAIGGRGIVSFRGLTP